MRRGLGQPCWGLTMPMGPQHSVNLLLRRLQLPLCRAVSACSGCGTRGEGCVVGAACQTGDGVTPRSAHWVPLTPARAVRSGTAPLALRCGQHASECLEKVSKVKISTGTLEKIHESSSQGCVIFKVGPKANPCKGKCLFSLFPSRWHLCRSLGGSSSRAGRGAQSLAAPAAPSRGFSLRSYYKFRGTNQHLPIRK